MLGVVVKMNWLSPRYLLRAQALLQAGRLPGLLAAVSQKRRRQVTRLEAVKNDLLLLQQLATAWVRGEYRAVSTKALLSVVAALLYFVSPVDALPDWLLGIGFVDDIAVLAMVLKNWANELDQFRDWLQQDAQRQALPLGVIGE